jgi:hypothetical protein
MRPCNGTSASRDLRKTAAARGQAIAAFSDSPLSCRRDHVFYSQSRRKPRDGVALWKHRVHHDPGCLGPGKTRRQTHPGSHRHRLTHHPSQSGLSRSGHHDHWRGVLRDGQHLGGRPAERPAGSAQHVQPVEFQPFPRHHRPQPARPARSGHPAHAGTGQWPPPRGFRHPEQRRFSGHEHVSHGPDRTRRCRDRWQFRRVRLRCHSGCRELRPEAGLPRSADACAGWSERRRRRRQLLPTSWRTAATSP